MISDIEAWFIDGCGRCERFATPDCSVRTWHAGLLALRHLCLGAGLVETVKWGQPCYMHAGRNIVIFGALRGDFRLGFFHAGLMKDPDGVLVRQGPNTPHPDAIRFTDFAQVEALAPVVRAYLDEAKAYAEAGLVAPKARGEPDLPAELVEALAADAELAEAFGALTPGRRKSYVIHLASAKAPATRIARIARVRPHILAGKGATER